MATIKLHIYKRNDVGKPTEDSELVNTVILEQEASDPADPASFLYVGDTDTMTYEVELRGYADAELVASDVPAQQM